MNTQIKYVFGRWLAKTFGYVVREHWQLDTFGHSGVNAALSAMGGITSMFFSRLNSEVPLLSPLKQRRNNILSVYGLGSQIPKLSNGWAEDSSRLQASLRNWPFTLQWNARRDQYSCNSLGLSHRGKCRLLLFRLSFVTSRDRQTGWILP